MAEAVSKADLERGIQEIAQEVDRGKRGLARIRAAHGKVSENLDQMRKVAPFMPAAGAALSYLTGRGDAMISSPDVRNPVTLLAAFTLEVGCGIAAWAGWNLTAIATGSLATATIAALTHDVGYAAGSAGKAQG